MPEQEASFWHSKMEEEGLVRCQHLQGARREEGGGRREGAFSYKVYHGYKCFQVYSLTVQDKEHICQTLMPFT